MHIKMLKLSLKSANFQLEDAKEGDPDYVKNGYIAGVEQATILRDSIMKVILKNNKF